MRRRSQILFDWIHFLTLCLPDYLPYRLPYRTPYRLLYRLPYHTYPTELLQVINTGLDAAFALLPPLRSPQAAPIHADEAGGVTTARLAVGQERVLHAEDAEGMLATGH